MPPQKAETGGSRQRGWAGQTRRLCLPVSKTKLVKERGESLNGVDGSVRQGHETERGRTTLQESAAKEETQNRRD